MRARGLCGQGAGLIVWRLRNWLAQMDGKGHRWLAIQPAHSNPGWDAPRNLKTLESHQSARCARLAISTRYVGSSPRYCCLAAQRGSFPGFLCVSALLCYVMSSKKCTDLVAIRRGISGLHFCA